MSNFDILTNSSNPLNVESIRKIIELYSLNGNLHTSIMSANRKNSSRIDVGDKEKFNKEMFIKWKNEILGLSIKEASILYEEIKIDRDFVPLRNLLMNHKDIEDPNEFIKLCEENDLRKTYDAYKWNSKGKDNTPWIYATSNKIYSHKVDPFKISHNLYINTNCDDTYNMAYLFMNKCEEEKIPYLFKICESPFRDDSIIIYSSDELLDKHMNVLAKIKEENANLISRVNNPPILTAKIDYFGYGSEPVKEENGRYRSFSTVRSNMIENVVADSARKWLFANRNLSLNGFTIMDALVKECSTRVIDSMKKNYSNSLEYEKELAKNNKYEYEEETLDNKIGYNLTDLNNPEFINNIAGTIRTGLPKVLCDDKLFGRYPNKEAITIPLNGGKTYALTYGDVARIIKRNAVGITKFDSNFIPRVLEGITAKCNSEKIEVNNFAFSKDFVIRESEEKTEETIIDMENLEFPKFDELKELATNYKVEFDKDKNKLQVININTNEVEEDAVKAQNAFFANVWLTSTGLKFVEGEKRQGLTDAFDVDGALLYKFFVKGCKHSLEKTGNLNSLFLYKNSAKLKMSGADNMIARLFSNDYQTMFIDNYVHARIDSNMPRTKKCEPLIDVETANKKLEAALNKKKK